MCENATRNWNRVAKTHIKNCHLNIDIIAFADFDQSNTYNILYIRLWFKPHFNRPMGGIHRAVWGNVRGKLFNHLRDNMRGESIHSRNVRSNSSSMGYLLFTGRMKNISEKFCKNFWEWTIRIHVKKYSRNSARCRRAIYIQYPTPSPVPPTPLPGRSVRPRLSPSAYLKYAAKIATMHTM